MNEQRKGHTPGPWDTDGGWIRTGDWEILIPAIDRDTAIADAALISAAPAMLAALEKWAEFMRENYTVEELAWYEETEAAIRKAKGE